MSTTHPSPENSNSGLLLAVAGTVSVSTNFVTAKHGVTGFGVETFSLVWATAAAVYALLAVLSFGRWRNLALPREAVATVACLGVCTGVGMPLTWSGLHRLDPSFASFLWRFAPVVSILLSGWLLGERLSLKELPPTGLITAGSIVTAIGDWDAIGTGMLLTLLACLSSAVQSILAKTIIDRVRPDVLTFCRVSIAALVIAAWTIPRGKVDLSNPAGTWGATLAGAFLGPCLSFLMTYRALQYWDLSRVSLVRMTQPFFVFIMAYAAFRTIPSSQQLIGGLLILVGATWFVGVHHRVQDEGLGDQIGRILQQETPVDASLHEDGIRKECDK